MKSSREEQYSRRISVPEKYLKLEQSQVIKSQKTKGPAKNAMDECEDFFSKLEEEYGANGIMQPPEAEKFNKRFEEEENYDFLMEDSSNGDSLQQSPKTARQKQMQNLTPSSITFGQNKHASHQVSYDSKLEDYLHNESNGCVGGPHNQSKNEEMKDELDHAIEKITFNIVSFGFPHPGNLRSSKRKDTRLRLKCITSMLKQRQKDLDFRERYQQQFNKLEQDKEIFQEKYRATQQKNTDLEKEKYSLKLQVKEKQDELKEEKDRQKGITKGASSNSNKLESKINSLQCELKKLELYNVKLQEQLKRQIGLDKAPFANSIEMTAAVQAGQSVQRSVPELELFEQVKQGNAQQMKAIEQENNQLKDCLFMLQQELKEIMEQQFIQLYKEAQQVPSLLQEVNILQGKSTLNQVLTPLTLNIPQSSQSMQSIYKTFMDNLKKLKQYFSFVFNPVTVGKVMMDINAVILMKNSSIKPVMSLQGLQKIIALGVDRYINIVAQQQQQQIQAEQKTKSVTQNLQPKPSLQEGIQKSTSQTRAKWSKSPVQREQKQQPSNQPNLQNNAQTNISRQRTQAAADGQSMLEKFKAKNEEDQNMS